MSDGLDLFLDHGVSTWWLYDITEGGPVLADPEKMPQRPSGARPSGGNPYTPYYKSEEHYDALHIHILARGRYNADAKALSIYQEHYHGQEFKRPKTPSSE